jgi:trehalose synthase
MTNLKEKTITDSLNLGSYKQFSPQTVKAIFASSTRLQGKTILHLNATPEGGGVAELLTSQIKLERSLGINSRWFYIDAPLSFFQTTKKIHNLLQGLPGHLSIKEQNVYLNTIKSLSGSFSKIIKRIKPDILVVHDPQPLPLIKFCPPGIKTFLRLHIDLSEPNPPIIKFLSPFIKSYDQIILSSKDYISSLPKQVQNRANIIQPAINPLSKKNQIMPHKKATSIIKHLGIDPNKPIISQVSRFDSWKDPLGVIRAFTIAKEKLPKLQLILAGIMIAKDDPEALSVLKAVEQQASSDPHIFVFSDENQIKPYEIDQFINSIYTASTVVIQKSLKEGFGLTITEAMWKTKPVIGGDAPGIRMQIVHNKNGLIVANEFQAAKAIIELIKKPRLRKRLGKNAKASVKIKFLLPKFILENLKIYLN